MVTDGALGSGVAGDGHGRREIVTPARELDMATGPQLVEEVDRLVEQGATAIDVTLAGVTFIDSSGLHALVKLKNRYTQSPSGVDLRIVEATHRIRRLFAIAALDSFLD